MVRDLAPCVVTAAGPGAVALLDAMPRRPLRVWPTSNAFGAVLCLVVFVPLLWFAGRPVWDTLHDDMTLPGNSPTAA